MARGSWLKKISLTKLGEVAGIDMPRLARQHNRIFAGISVDQGTTFAPSFLLTHDLLFRMEWRFQANRFFIL